LHFRRFATFPQRHNRPSINTDNGDDQGTEAQSEEM
jgi:hypothetical protein